MMTMLSAVGRRGAVAARLWQAVPPRLLHTPAPGGLDKVLLKGLVFHGYHGVYEEENRLGQKFVVDATLFTDLRQAGQTDDLHHTVNYAQVYEDIKGIMEGPPQKLIESVAERIAQHILRSQPSVQCVQVGVCKPHVAVSGVVESLGIEITRARQQP